MFVSVQQGRDPHEIDSTRRAEDNANAKDDLSARNQRILETEIELSLAFLALTFALDAPLGSVRTCFIESPERMSGTRVHHREIE